MDSAMSLLTQYCASVMRSVSSLHLFCVLLFMQIGSGACSNQFDLANEKPYPSPQHFVKLVCDEAGLFWSMLNIIGALRLYEEGYYAGVKVDFGSDHRYGLYYDPARGSNWWNYYFEPIHVGNPADGPLFCTIHGDSERSYGNLTEFHTYRDQCHQIIKKYIHVKPHIKKKIKAFAARNFKVRVVVGVHYRGTDKYTEVPLAAYDRVFEKLSELIKKIERRSAKEIRIFVATDEQPFLDYLNAAYPDKIISYDALRSSNGQPVHYAQDLDNYQKGEDAVIDCLLLAYCQALIKTSSNLSLCASYFNPKIPVYHVTSRPNLKPLEGFILTDEN